VHVASASPSIGECDLDGIVHAAAADGFDLAAVELAAEDACRLAGHHLAVGLLDGVAMPAVAPVEPAIGAEEGAMNVGGVAGEAKLCDEFRAFVGLAIAVGVFELPQARRRTGVQSALVPEDAHRQRHVVGEDGGLVEDAVAVGVFEKNDAVRLLLEEVIGAEIDAGGFGDEEPAPVIEAGEHRMFDQRRPGDLLDGEPGWNLERERFGGGTLLRQRLQSARGGGAGHGAAWGDSGLLAA
jgi:hypothetical protein